MKMQPVTYRLELREGSGFTQFRNDKLNWVYKRDVVMRPFVWVSGSAVEFSILEFYSSSEGLKERVLCSSVFYDKDYPAVRQLMDNLASGDLRGNGAEMTAHSLYWKLFLPTEE